nr:aldose epimerase family protein [Maritimibacter dapengensis]
MQADTGDHRSAGPDPGEGETEGRGPLAQDEDDIRHFGTLPDGSPVEAVTIRGGGATAVVLTQGARLQDFRLADVAHPLILGSPDLTAYLGPMRFFGAIVGPVANRIAGGRFMLNDRAFALERNEAGKTTLHGGETGFSQQNWNVSAVAPDAVSLQYIRPDGTGGFPGTLDVRARYSLDQSGCLTLEITAQTDAPTPFAPAFHGYWDLSGQGDLGAHRLHVHADTYLPVDGDQIPTGRVAPVAETPFDYRRPRELDPALDHNFCIATEQGPLRPVCQLSTSSLSLDVESTEIGLQVHAGGSLDTRPFPGHDGKPYGPGAGIALEPQFWPDTPNHPTFPNATLLPGATYRQITRFSARTG